MRPLRSIHDREIAILAIPALGSLIADPLLSLVDTAFVGRLGSDALGALGIASALFAVAFFLFNFLEYGTTTVVARAVGADDLPAAGRATLTAFALAGVAGTVVTVALLVFVDDAVAALGASGQVALTAASYVSIRALAAPAVLAVRAAHGAFRGYQDTRTPFVITLFINGINLVLDPLLIFGFDWGVAGAAWATVTAQWVGAVVFVVLFYRRRSRYGLIGARPVAGEVRRFLVVGRDLAIRTTALLAAFTLSTAVAARVSASAIAAHQVLMQVFVFMALALDALAIAAQAMIAKQVGSLTLARAREVADRLLVLGFGFGVLVAALLAALYPVLPGWFSTDPAVQHTIRQAYWIVVLIQPLGALVFVWDGVFIGAGDFVYLAWAMVASALVAGVVLLLVLPLGWGLAGVWWSIVVLLGMRAVTLGWRRASVRGPLRPA